MNHLIQINGSPNYAAMVVEYDEGNVVNLPGRDRVVGYKVLGYQSIIGKDSYTQGELLVVFGAETQLSEAYASVNNLYRHEHLNADPTVKGYLDDNRRVRAIRLGGHRSDALVMPLSSLHSFINCRSFDYENEQRETMQYWVSEGGFAPGVAFDHFDGLEVCRKYVIPTKHGEGRIMKKITTESGAIYHYDEENSRVMREGPNSPGIDYESTPDDAWLPVIGSTGLEVGQSCYFAIRGNRYRITTPAVTIEEVES